MKKIVITGGLGFIGSNLVRKLCKNYHVLIVDKQTYSSNLDNLSGISKKNYTLYKIDICNQNKFYNLIRKHSPICIFNLAAETHVDRSIDSPREFINTNILGTYSILEALRKYHKKNKKIKFIHISTDEVYGDIKKKSFSKESDPYKPSSPYAASKASSDHLVYSYFRTFKLPVIVTNCSNNYGPRQFPEKLIPKIIINCLNNKPVPIYGNGLNEREWIHVEDHVSALIKIFRKGKYGEFYNIGSGEILNNLTIARLIIKIIKNKFNIKTSSRVLFVKDRPGHDVRYALNSNKMKSKIKWKKKFSVNKGLDETIEWYLANSQWIKKLNKKNYINRLGLK